MKLRCSASRKSTLLRPRELLTWVSAVTLLFWQWQMEFCSVSTLNSQINLKVIFYKLYPVVKHIDNYRPTMLYKVCVCNNYSKQVVLKDYISLVKSPEVLRKERARGDCLVCVQSASRSVISSFVSTNMRKAAVFRGTPEHVLPGGLCQSLQYSSSYCNYNCWQTTGIFLLLFTTAP